MDLEDIVKRGRFDLHLHTTASDGSYSPTEIVEMAALKGLETIAITDHDTTEGIPEALAAGQVSGIHVIPGIELSTKYKGKNIDILGYHIGDSGQLQKVLSEIRVFRENRAHLMIDKLNDSGIPISAEDVIKHAKGEVIARPHIAMAVVEKGFANTMQEVFDFYLGDGKPCAVDKMVLSPQEGIDLIHESGGEAVLAHPLLIHNDGLVEELLQLPFDGIEVWHRKHKAVNVKKYKKLAMKYNKLLTGGSDFHNSKHEIGMFGFRLE